MSYAPGEHRDHMPTRLSLWEIAHRWENENPLTDEIVSTAVADRLRWLLIALAEDEEAQRAEESATFDGEVVVIRDLAQELRDVLDAVNAGKPPVDPLKDWDVLVTKLDQLCFDYNLPLPDFWFKFAQSEAAKPGKMRGNLSRRDEVISLAKQLFSDHPALTRPVQIAELPEMQELLAGIHVTPKTKRAWIGEANPHPPQKGRRKKTSFPK